MTDTVALDMVFAAGGDIEQQIDQMIGQQVDFIDVEQTAMGAGEQARREAYFTILQCLL